ncbi:MAG: aldehyde ferredoxin oxidoreductase family protein [Desulfobacterales bacterium]|jgi:aldehyde:ferredoxin oxidoreductase
MANGYMGKIGFVDLTTGEIRHQRINETLIRDYIGGYGLGVRIMFEHQTKGADPLGPDNILGFTAGTLTGTKTPASGRYMTVCKSPLTGGWGDANSGGYFGNELKSAGWDAIFICGAAATAKWVLIRDETIEIRDASHLWGKDTVETEVSIREELNEPKMRVATIGPASERLSLISGIVNDKGRIAARSGVGAVMGSKKLKAVAVRGTGKVGVADKNTLDEVRRKFIKQVREMPGMPEAMMKYGTCGFTAGLVASGATPVKNWQLTGEEAFPNLTKITDVDIVLKHQTRKYACANCPIACGGIFNVTGGKYPVGEVHKPEYETIAAFGTMCVNDDFESIIKLNDMCNRSGLDTISAGTVLAFAMECFENGIISESDTDGIAMTWGNTDAMIVMLEKIIAREGFGDVLADGVKRAAEKIGNGADEFAVHVGGQEPGLHSPLLLPGRGVGYIGDPTPGRHTAAPMARIDAGAGAAAPYPELNLEGYERHAYTGKGPLSAKLSSYLQVGNCAGICLMPMIFFGNYPLLEFFNAVTGLDIDLAEVFKTGARIQTLRQCFNLREGIGFSDIKLPGRLAGRPPMTEGPVSGITVDVENLVAEYFQAMGWDPVNGEPQEAALEKLGLVQLIKKYG